MPRTTRKTSKWVLEQIQPKTSLKAEMTTKTVHFGYIMRGQGSLKKTMTLRSIGRQQDRRKTNYEMS